jgi:hypothetical protein
MLFSVLPVGAVPPGTSDAEAFLVTDNWDDWFTYQTTYTLHLRHGGIVHNIGLVKVGQFEMAERQSRPNLPSNFQ